MHAVLRHIDAHLAEPLTLARLAGVAHFSPFHFHRLFAAWMGGETLGDYLGRRRLELAACRMLAQPRLTVLELALAVGFGSGEAFSRAFKSRFGSTPTSWRLRMRQDRNLDQLRRKIDQAAAEPVLHNRASLVDQGTRAMHVRLVERPETAVTYLRYEGPLGLPVQAFWRQRVSTWLAQNQLQQQALFGISHDDPGIGDPDRCRYDAAVALPAGFASGPGCLTSVLPGGRYAALPFYGRSDRIGEAWTALLRDWLPDSGWQLDHRPCFEHYPVGARVDAQTGEFECEICIPVVSL